MAFNEKLITPDIVEILDVKILTSSNHPAIFALAGERYDDVLARLTSQLLTPGQQEAISSTLTAPSASNPVVLFLDIPVYYPPQDLGEIKDAVNAVIDLPLAVTPTGDTTIGLTTITNVSSMSSVIPQQAVSGPGIPANAYVVSVGINFFDINLAATATAVGVVLNISPVLSDVRPVLSLNTLYRWDGVAWNPFMSTGTLDHTQLINQNGDPTYQHITQAEKSALTAQNHIHGFVFDPADVDAGTDTINVNPDGLLNDTPVTFSSSGVLPGGLIGPDSTNSLQVPTLYYIVNRTPTSIQVSTSIGGGALDITSQGTNFPSSINSHVTSTVPHLELITNAGSGIIISDAERSRIPSPDEKAALQGTAGSPSVTNRYVTNQDPRLNTIRNPYVTVGSSTPTCSYPGDKVKAFDNAIEGISSFPCSINVASPAVVTVNHIYEDGDQVYFQTPVSQITITGDLTITSPIVTNVSSVTDLAIGQKVLEVLTDPDALPGVPAGATIIAVGFTSFTMNFPATATTIGVGLNVFPVVGALPTGLLPETTYYVANSNPTQFNVSLSNTLFPLVDTTAPGNGIPHVGGNNTQAKAIEVLPDTYVMHAPDPVTPNNSNLRWSLQEGGCLIECITPLEATLSWRTFTDSIEVLPPGTGPVTIRGFRFILDGPNTRGVLFQRDYCTIEDCSFTGITAIGELHKGVTVDANYVKVSRCTFDGLLVSGIDVKGDNCRIENCTFNLSNPASLAVDIYPSINNTKISNSVFDNSTINIQVNAINTQLSGNTFDSVGTTASVVDAGVNTRFLDSPSYDGQNHGQAFIGKKRTLGPLGSMADYRGATEAIFNTALADPYVEELEVLEGTYTFASTVVVPSGKSVYGVTQNSTVVSRLVNITGALGVTVFDLGSDVTLHNLKMTSSNAPTVTITGSSNIKILRCIVNCAAVDSVDDYGIDMSAGSDLMIWRTTFDGVRGLRILGSTKVKLTGNNFSASGIIFESDALCEDCHIKDNYFLSGTANIQGLRLIVEGNHFLSALPSKLGTTSSVWQNNYPHPQANNFEGVDYRVISLDKYLVPRTPGCDFSSVLDFGVLSYLKTATASAITLPLDIQARVDKTSGYDIKLVWTSNASSGDVRWSVSSVFKDEIGGNLGTPQVLAITSPRTNLAVQLEEAVTLNFPASYGLAPLVDPTHVSVEVTRLPFDVADTLPAEAFLINASLTFRRD